MKKKVNLTNLLAKYEGNSPVYREASPSPRSDAVRESKYNQNGWGNTYQFTDTNVNSIPVTGNFQMSKSECEQFLLRVKEQIRKQERALDNLADSSMKEIHMKFQANHEKIKREILNLLEKAFQDNERYITEQLKKQGNSQPHQFLPVHKKITQIDEEINRLLYGLKSTDYRRCIAEVVMKDYSMQLSSLKETVNWAKQSFLSSLGEVEPDRSRIQCIREDLQKLFKLSKKNAGLIQQSFFGVLGQKFKMNQIHEQNIQKSAKFDNMKSSTTNAGFLLSPSSKYQQQENHQPQRQSQRKSMFNFGIFQ